MKKRAIQSQRNLDLGKVRGATDEDPPISSTTPGPVITDIVGLQKK